MNAYHIVILNDNAVFAVCFSLCLDLLNPFSNTGQASKPPALFDSIRYNVRTGASVLLAKVGVPNSAHHQCRTHCLLSML